MIAFVRGIVAEVGREQAVIDIGGGAGGIGISVQCTPATLADLRVGQAAHLATSLSVREDGWTVYGFQDADARSVFETVQTVSGVGPRLAQAMLATLTPDEIRRAVATEDLATLTRIPGVGRKGAQRLVLELKERMGPAAGGDAPTAVTGAAAEPWRSAVHAGLTSLGWSARDADGAVAEVEPLAAEQLATVGRADVSALLKAALRGLAPSAEGR